jgi:hypothetical protein
VSPCLSLAGANAWTVERVNARDDRVKRDVAAKRMREDGVTGHAPCVTNLNVPYAKR